MNMPSYARNSRRWMSKGRWSTFRAFGARTTNHHGRFEAFSGSGEHVSRCSGILSSTRTSQVPHTLPARERRVDAHFQQHVQDTIDRPHLEFLVLRPRTTLKLWYSDERLGREIFDVHAIRRTARRKPPRTPSTCRAGRNSRRGCRLDGLECRREIPQFSICLVVEIEMPPGRDSAPNVPVVRETPSAGGYGRNRPAASSALRSSSRWIMPITG